MNHLTQFKKQNQSKQDDASKIKKSKRNKNVSKNISKNVKKIKKREITLFTRELATLITAGIPLIQALQLLINTSEPPLKELILDIKTNIEKGHTLSTALKQEPNLFNNFYGGLIESGEQSGSLDISLTRLAHYLEKRDLLTQKIKKSLYYPITILITSIAVTLVFMLKVIPVFEELFRNFNAPLPLFTQSILIFSHFLQTHGLSLLLFLGLTTLILTQYSKKNPTVNEFFDRLSLKIPILGNLNQKNMIAQFARTFSTCYASGVPLINIFQTLAEGQQNKVYAKGIIDIKEAVIHGETIHEAIKTTHLFPEKIVQMIHIAEESGTLDKILDKIACLTEQEIEIAIEGLTTLLEPLMIIFLGLLVGALVIALYLPIMNMGALF